MKSDKTEEKGVLECYLDNSATTKPCKEAVEACNNALLYEYGNPSSLHKKGFAAQKLVEGAKEELAQALGCTAAEVLFTSGATESNNMALFGAAEVKKRSGHTIVVSAIEHPSLLAPAAHLEQQGYRIKRVLPDANGRYTPQLFADAVDDDTVFVSAMLVNNETGLILPVAEIAKAVKKKNPNVIFHTDLVQGFLKIPVKLKNTAVDLASVSGHKVQAPKGIGALYIKKGVRLIPLLYGGGQQNGIRSGTESVPLIAAFGAAVAAQKDSVAANRSHYEKLKKHLMQNVSGFSDVTVHSGEECAPHIISLSVRGIRSEILLHFLETKDVYVSSGSACAKGKPSYVLSALGRKKPDADETIRVSFSPDTTDAMIDQLTNAIRLGADTLQKIR